MEHGSGASEVMNKLGMETYKQRFYLLHPVHAEHAEAVKTYDCTLERTKEQHWRGWLEHTIDPDIWTVHKGILAPASDGAKATIPALKHRKEGNRRHQPGEVEGTSQIFLLSQASRPRHSCTRNPVATCKLDQITKEQIALQIRKLKPHQAPGPDSIPNIVLIRCADLLIDRVHFIYKAMVTVECKLHYTPWKTFTTTVLHNPGKPKYNIPKAYRPIALLNTMWKVLANVLADQLPFKFSFVIILNRDSCLLERIACGVEDRIVDSST